MSYTYLRKTVHELACACVQILDYKVGTPVWHPIRGVGLVISVDADDLKKPYVDDDRPKETNSRMFYDD